MDQIKPGILPYEEEWGHPADFEVQYRFYTLEEGGRVTGPPMQHYRCDWGYDGFDQKKDGLFMIHPEFLTPEGEIFPDGEPVPREGRATMWILIPGMRTEVHRDRIRPGVKGYFLEGCRRVGEATVTRVIGLHTNPS